MDLNAILFQDEPIAGVEISDDAIRLVLAKRNKTEKTIEITQKIEVPLAQGIIFGGQILQDEQFTAALKQLRSQTPRKIQYVIASIDPERVYAKVFSFPNSVHGQRLDETIGLAINYQLPMPVNQVYTDWQILSQGEDIKVLIAAAQRENIDRYLEAFTAAKFSLVAIESYPLSLYRALGDNPDPEHHGIVIRALSHGAIHVYGFVGDSLVLSRFLPEDKISGQAAENEIKNILDYFEVEFGSRPAAQDFAALPLRKDLAGSIASESNSQRWAIALGAAVRGMTSRADDRAVSVFPVSTQAAYQFKKAIRFSQLVSNVLIASSLVFSLAFAGSWAFMINLQKKSTHNQAVDIPLPQQSIDDQKKLDRVNSLVAIEGSALRTRVEWSRMLAEVNSKMVDGITINRASFTSPLQPMSLTGVASTRTQLNAFKKSLESSDMLDNINLPLTNLDVTANIPFTITFALKDPNALYSK